MTDTTAAVRGAIAQHTDKNLTEAQINKFLLDLYALGVVLIDTPNFEAHKAEAARLEREACFQVVWAERNFWLQQAIDHLPTTPDPTPQEWETIYVQRARLMENLAEKINDRGAEKTNVRE